MQLISSEVVENTVLIIILISLIQVCTCICVKRQLFRQLIGSDVYSVSRHGYVVCSAACDCAVVFALFTVSGSSPSPQALTMAKEPQEHNHFNSLIQRIKEVSGIPMWKLLSIISLYYDWSLICTSISCFANAWKSCCNNAGTPKVQSCNILQ